MDVIKYGRYKYYGIEQILRELEQNKTIPEVKKLRELINNTCDLREVYNILKNYGYEFTSENCNNCIFAEIFKNNDNLIYCTSTRRENYKARWCANYRGESYERRRQS